MNMSVLSKFMNSKFLNNSHVQALFCLIMGTIFLLIGCNYSGEYKVFIAASFMVVSIFLFVAGLVISFVNPVIKEFNRRK